MSKFVIQATGQGYVFFEGTTKQALALAQQLADRTKQYVDWGLLGSKQRNYRRKRTFPSAAAAKGAQ